MQAVWILYLVQIFFVLSLVIKIEAVTVNPLCPTNKIAPHRRSSRASSREDRRSARTIGAIYNLLVPDNPPSHLQEEPQNESNDCGEIEDYDENDLSSLTPSPNGENRRQGQRYLFNNPFGALFQSLSYNNRPQTTTTIKYKPTRPPTGGYFGTNTYRPQPEQQPSANIKPVQEGYTVSETDVTYRPVLVGAPSGQIVGALQVRPTRNSLSQAAAQTQHQYSNYAHPSYIPHNKYPNRPRNTEDTGILESFIHLLF